MSKRSLITLAAIALALLPGWDLVSAQSPMARDGYVLTEATTILDDFPTGLTVDDAGEVYCITYTGKVYRFSGPYTAGPVTPVLFYDGTLDFTTPCTGITFYEGKFYVAHRATVSTLIDTDLDGTGDVVVDIITGLPWANDHQNNQIVFDDNGNMFFGVGTQTDHTVDTNPMSATIMTADQNGNNLAVHATGVRNAFGLAFKSNFGLVAGDNGPNALLTNPNAPDELNYIEAGLDYGYPDYYGFPAASTGTEDPIFEIPAHAAPTGMTFDIDSQWSGFSNDLYCCLFAGGAGSVARFNLTQSQVDQSYGASIHLIANGFLNAIDCKFAPTGDLLIADFTTKTIYAVRPLDTSRVRLRGEPRLGALIQITLCDPEESGDAYLAALSTLDTPGVTLGTQTLHLNTSTFAFGYTTMPNNGVLNFPGGFLNAGGKVNGSLFIPNDPALIGLDFWIGFVSASLPGLILGSVSETLPFKVLGA
ncbi:MAG: PQQ-dependent sugar dehydrogenase [Planctomycetota bacterium]